MNVRELIAELEQIEDKDRVVEISIWTGGGGVWLQVDAERIKVSDVYQAGDKVKKVVTLWTPATSEQYGDKRLTPRKVER